MTAKFRNIYRIESARLNGYNYSRNGAYFITICTKNHICIFGNVVVETGLRVETVETGLRPVSTDNNGNFNNFDNFDNYGHSNNSNAPNSITTKIQLSDEGKIVSDCWFDLPNHYLNIILDEFIVMPNHIHGIILIQNYSAEKQQHGLSEFVRAFKSFSSRRINEFRNTNQSETWQSRFYDHIIRSDNDLNRIRLYIKYNPDNWLNEQKHFSSVIIV